MKVSLNRWLLLFIGIALVGGALRTVPVRPFFEIDSISPASQFDSPSDVLVAPSINADIASIAERPLFNVSRRPPEVVTVPIIRQAQEPVLRAPTPKLMGTMKTKRGEIVAYVRFGDEADSVRLSVGDFRDPWEVESIADGTARLRNGGNVVELKLDQD
jgi:hypothetical protein